MGNYLSVYRLTIRDSILEYCCATFRDHSGMVAGCIRDLTFEKVQRLLNFLNPRILMIDSDMFQYESFVKLLETYNCELF